MKCINCDHLIESESIEGGEFAFFCEINIQKNIVDPENDGCDIE